MAAEIAARISAAPEILAWVISIGQLVAGLALVLGVFARSAALLMLVLVVANAVALTRYEAFFVRDNGLEYPLALAALCLAVAAQGAGALRLQLGSKFSK
jgi:putative oxidoreductase